MNPSQAKKPGRWSLGEYVRTLSFRPGCREWVAGLADGRLVWMGCGEGDAAGKEGGIRADLRGHRGGVLAASWSPDGAFFATGGEDGSLAWWQSNGERVRDHRLAGGWVEQVAWCGDGRWLAAASGRHVRLFDREGNPGRAVEPLTGAVAAVQWSPGLSRFVAVGNGWVRLLSVDDPGADRTVSWPAAFVSMACSPDGLKLAAGTQERTVMCWTELGTQVEPFRMSGYEGKVRALGWDRSSRWLASGGGEQITVWDVSGRGPAGSEPLQLEGHEARVVGVAFAPRGAVLASGAEDGVVRLWNLPAPGNGLLAARLKSAVTVVAWAPAGGMLGVGGLDGEVVVLQ